MALDARVTLVVDVTELRERDRNEFEDELRRLVSRYRREPDAELILGWTQATLAEAFRRIEHSGRGAATQVKAIHWALQNGGTVGRREVFKIGGFSRDRSLHGFTRPVNRVVAEMKDAGEIPSSAANLIETMYNTGPKADGFRVPVELATLLT